MPELDSPTAPDIEFVFSHGWGMQDSFFDPLIEQLQIDAPRFLFRDYFGSSENSRAWNGDNASNEDNKKRWIGIGHSFGFSRLLRENLEHCVALVSLCGFVDFCGEGGADPRVVQRMIRKLERDPQTVVEDFRNRCGGLPGSLPDAQQWNVALLKTDLEEMCESSTKAIAPLSSVAEVPVLALASDDDPIVPAALTRNQFADPFIVPGCQHLLGFQHADLCAIRIREFTLE